jgi:lipopolysaccharide/colanic/teichoic acid biosynthesis glycosyltransferase
MRVFEFKNVIPSQGLKSFLQPRLLGGISVSPPLGEAARGKYDAVPPAVIRGVRPVPEKPLYDLCKRGLDVTVALLVLLVGLPVFVIVALLIMATSPGPVLFKQRRLGRGGKVFWCYKFRTMVLDAEKQLEQNAVLRQQYRESYKLQNDPRVTTIGAFLRKSSIDELPQCLNVLLGDMSLIGPRPIVPPELSKYGVYGEKLLAVKPGLSGLWQASGRSDTSYEERVQMDMTYIDSRCIRLDLLLLFRTVRAVLKRSGAC